jgi:hypothetical protein
MLFSLILASTKAEVSAYKFDEMDASDLEMDSEDEDELRPEYVLVKPPSQLSPDFIQRHKHYGLAVADGTNGIDFAYEENFWDVEEKLRSFFPTLFEWFDTLPKVEGNSDNRFGDPVDLPQWLLCTKLPGRSSGVSIAAGVAFPTGSDIEFNVETKRSGFREKTLILSKYYGYLIHINPKLMFTQLLAPPFPMNS